jgi:hypothetical protein
MQSRRLTVNHHIYDHADEVQEHREHEVVLERSRCKKKISNSRKFFSLPISTSLTCNVSFNCETYSKSSAMYRIAVGGLVIFTGNRTD